MQQPESAYMQQQIHTNADTTKLSFTSKLQEKHFQQNKNKKIQKNRIERKS
jgi:hypothetical protein